MNERIKELALEARLGPALLLHYWGKVDALTDTEQEALEQIEKFAELIVQECEKVISDGRYSAMACEGNSHRVSYNNGRYGASLDIKKHFGVEE